MSVMTTELPAKVILFDALGRRARGTIESPVLVGEEFYNLPLNKGQLSRLDPDDFLKYGQFRYRAFWSKGTKSYYAVREGRLNGKKIEYKLAREILGLVHGDPLVADHINHDTLDNRRCNLRAITHQQNTQNRRSNANNSTGSRGLRQVKGGKWEARICVDGKNIGLGRFILQEDAAIARRAAELNYFGEYANKEIA